MRYKRNRRYRSRVVKMRFQSFFDMSTQPDQMQIISVNAGGPDVMKRLAPFFSAYKYYRLGSVSFKAVPASTLPVSPSGLSYEIDEPGVDPRDQLTPGMARITNGEDILEDITGLSAEAQHELYNNMLLDPRWFKWMLQSGVKRYGKPKYWQIGQLHQDKWPGSTINVPYYIDNALLPGTKVQFGTGINQISEKTDVTGTAAVTFEARGSSKLGLFQTGHRGTLGWLPTDSCQDVWNGSDSNYGRDMKPMLASIPEIELFKILMPPAYKTRYYYRVFVTETVLFKDPIVMNLNGYRPIDVFHNNPRAVPMLPTSVQSVDDSSLEGATGGNYGDD